MLEKVDLNAQLDKDAYKTRMGELDARLAQLQRELREAGIPVMVVFEGWDAAGKGSLLSRIIKPFDPRGYKVHNITPPTEDDRMRPPMWRYWNRLPQQGFIAIYNHSWHRQVLEERVDNGMAGFALSSAYDRINCFERTLADGGAIIVKFFMHITKKEQAKRFKKMRKDPAFAWKVGKLERQRHKRYESYYDAVQDMLRETSGTETPWTVIAATDERWATVQIAETLMNAFEKGLAHKRDGLDNVTALASRTLEPLETVDLRHSLGRDAYDESLPKLQTELRRLQHLCYVHRIPVVIVYEGWDAAGKGGNIRRVIRELDPRGYEVIPIAAPQGDEKTHHYLWRFWRAFPKAGHFTIFDRSWYGRVLVERVEAFAPPRDWMRAYSEINEFEQQIVEYGAVIAKFWLHISKEEQLLRFEARQHDPAKQWKITEEDWRNRAKWDEYWEAVSDMLDRTSTAYAPWTIIEGNDKLHARIQALQTLVSRIEKALTLRTT